MLFMVCDIATCQSFFNENKADVRVEIVPCRAMPPQRSTGVSYEEQLVHASGHLKRHGPVVPVTVILIDS
jgi:hypothetical protein